MLDVLLMFSVCPSHLRYKLFYKNQLREIRTIFYFVFYKIIFTYDQEDTKRILGEHLAFPLLILSHLWINQTLVCVYIYNQFFRFN
jgi:hypothetical protein